MPPSRDAARRAATVDCERKLTQTLAAARICRQRAVGFDRQASFAPGHQGQAISARQMARRRDILSCDLLTMIVPVSGTPHPFREPMSGDVEGPEEGAAECFAEAHRRVDLLYRDQAATLRRRLRARLRSNEEASDLVHDAFARLLRACTRERLREPEAFLHRIVRNLLIDRSRRLAARPPHVAIEGERGLAVPAVQSDAIEVAQMRDRYREVVASLPARMREVFVLHRVEELSYKEIAARLDISVRTVEWHIAEAIVRISKGLDTE